MASPATPARPPTCSSSVCAGGDHPPAGTDRRRSRRRGGCRGCAAARTTRTATTGTTPTRTAPTRRWRASGSSPPPTPLSISSAQSQVFGKAPPAATASHTGCTRLDVRVAGRDRLELLHATAVEMHAGFVRDPPETEVGVRLVAVAASVDVERAVGTVVGDRHPTSSTAPGRRCTGRRWAIVNRPAAASRPCDGERVRQRPVPLIVLCDTGVYSTVISRRRRSGRGSRHRRRRTCRTRRRRRTRHRVRRTRSA